jgi:hypothetical protein
MVLTLALMQLYGTRCHTEDTDNICVYSVFFRVLPWLFMLYTKDDFRQASAIRTRRLLPADA